MPTFEFTSPDGKKYSVQGPAGATQEQAFAILQQQLGGASEKQKRIDKQAAEDRELYNPTKGMSGTDKFLAGVGKAMTDVGRGVGQLANPVMDFLSPRRQTLSGLITGDKPESHVEQGRREIAESRARDAALLDTGAGLAGNIVGNVTTLAPAMFIPGVNTLAGSAAVGAGAGLLQTSESTGETLRNVAIGGIISPAAILAGRGIQAGAAGLGAVRDTFTRAGQNRIAQDVLRASATNADDAARNLRAAQPLVPGSTPTAAQVARDPGLAQLERTMLNNPEMAAPLQRRFLEQQAARNQAVRNVAGTDDYFNAIRDGRRIFGNEDYARAMQQGIDPQMAQAMQPQIQSLMARPSMQQAQNVARRLAAESDQAIDDFGSIQGMDWLKKALDNQISAASQPGNALGRADLRALMQTRDDLLSVLDEVAPAYREAGQNYAQMSRQVNSMEVARDLLRRYEPVSAQYGNNSREMANAYQRALSDATDSVKRQTGMNLPLDSVMNHGDITALENVARDLARKQYTQEAGKAVGSNTAQNMVSQNLLRRFMGPTGLPEGLVDNTVLQTLLRPVEFAGRLATPNIQNRMTELMLDPQATAAALQAARAYQAPAANGNALLRLATQPALLTGGFAANRPEQ